MLEQLVLQREVPGLSHLCRMQHGVLFEEQLEGILELNCTEQLMTQLSLLYLAYLAVGFKSLFQVALSNGYFS